MAKIVRAQGPNEDETLAPAPPLPPNASAGKRWRFRRNLVINVAHRDGISQRMLSEVFDLPRSRVAAILEEFSRFIRPEASRRDGPTPVPAPPLPPNASVGKRWRFRRNLVINVASRSGLSQRMIADVFDLPRSRVAAILKEFSRPRNAVKSPALVATFTHESPPTRR